MSTSPAARYPRPTTTPSLVRTISAPAVGALPITARPRVVRTVTSICTVSPGAKGVAPRARSMPRGRSSPLGTMEPQVGNVVARAAASVTNASTRWRISAARAEAEARAAEILHRVDALVTEAAARATTFPTCGSIVPSGDDLPLGIDLALGATPFAPGDTVQMDVTVRTTRGRPWVRCRSPPGLAWSGPSRPSAPCLRARVPGGGGRGHARPGRGSDRDGAGNGGVQSVHDPADRRRAGRHV